MGAPGNEQAIPGNVAWLELRRWNNPRTVVTTSLQLPTASSNTQATRGSLRSHRVSAQRKLRSPSFVYC